jgi:hypothetical protein
MKKTFSMHLENYEGEIITQDYEIEAETIEQAREILWDLILCGCVLYAEGHEIQCGGDEKLSPQPKKQWIHEEE